MRLYPILTDGKKFYHADEIHPHRCRTAYFSLLNYKEWVKREKSKYTEKDAKRVYDNWDKNKEKIENEN